MLSLQRLWKITASFFKCTWNTNEQKGRSFSSTAYWKRWWWKGERVTSRPGLVLVRHKIIIKIASVTRARWPPPHPTLWIKDCLSKEGSWTGTGEYIRPGQRLKTCIQPTRPSSPVWFWCPSDRRWKNHGLYVRLLMSGMKRNWSMQESYCGPNPKPYLI